MQCLRTRARYKQTRKNCAARRYIVPGTNAITFGLIFPSYNSMPICAHSGFSHDGLFSFSHGGNVTLQQPALFFSVFVAPRRAKFTRAASLLRIKHRRGAMRGTLLRELNRLCTGLCVTRPSFSPTGFRNWGLMKLFPGGRAEIVGSRGGRYWCFNFRKLGKEFWKKAAAVFWVITEMINCLCWKISW